MRKKIYLCRHGETEWSRSGQHTSVTDLSLTENGQKQAEMLHNKIKGINIDHVFCSPLKRAQETCKICNLLNRAVIDDDLFEWRYGDYEGITTKEIHRTVPDWSIFTHGAPNGESIDQIRERADRMIAKINAIDGDVALFSSGHFSRVFTVRWLDLPVEAGKHFILSTASLSILTFEHEAPAIYLWNEQ